ncbi:ligand-binding sensor domain-containing protein [Rubrolithibacter danxiaensis]|uniref:ligand-binding sensor domain-containing protein n=1 Tax=Rubrolithibacter danxiaensis TaxID=3390805 RepID=UPI003BF7DDD3
MKLKALFVFLCLIAIRINCYAQPYYFSRYLVENGLSNNTVFCSFQDSKGFLWFGTKDGLNRFDGYTFKIFRNDPENPTSIGSNSVKAIIEINDVLWVGTERGIFLYTSNTENFKRLKNSTQEDIKDIKADKKGNIWFIAGATLVRFNPRTHQYKRYKSSEYFEASSIAVTKNNEIWISASTGTIQKYNPVSDSFTGFNVFTHSKPTVSKWIERIYDTEKGQLLIGTSNQGVKLFDLNTHQYKDILTYNKDKTEIFARNFIRQSENEYWIATESGIFIYNIETGKYINIQKQYNDPYSISDNAIYTLCKDKEGGIWAGTYFGGVNYHAKPFTLFEKFFPRSGTNSISGNAVREIIEDKYNNLWIGTEDGGLNKFDPEKETFTTYKPTGSPSGIAHSNIHGILAVGDTLWVGTFEHGLDRMNIKTGKVLKHYSYGSDIHSLKSNFIYSIYRTRVGETFFCTTKGLYKYNQAGDNFLLIKEVPDYIFYTTMFEDTKGTLWLGTIWDGLFYFNPKTGKKGYFIHQADNKNSLVNNRVNRIFEDTAGNLWIATEGGLCMLNKGKSNFERYTIENGFPSNIIFSVLEDKHKLLWVTTSQGLVCFNPVTKKVKTYTKANGLLSDQFNYHSSFKDATGRMYFGSVNGLIRFNPDNFIKNSYIPPVYITGLQVFNKDLSINEKGSPLKKSITLTDKIRLEYNQSSISIDFAALSYTSPDMTEYAYKMEGLDKDWTYLKTNRKAYYTKLPPGKYTFKVKASNNTGIWNEKGTSLRIEILPPFWKSNWAYLLYCMLTASIIYFASRSYHNHIKEKNKRRLEFLEHEKEKEIYHAKIEFFTNVAHEIRTPLTLIKGPMEKVIKKAGDVPQIKNSLLIMEKNTDRLLDLANQLLDFRRTEIKGFSLNFVKADLVKILEDNYLRFKPAAEQKKLKFKQEIPLKSFYAYVDMEAFTKIISNLLNNAVKYAKSKVCIRLLDVKEGDCTFTILIKNDGYLIPYEMKDKIFESFFRIKGAEKQSGTGIGLSLARSLAELHKGTLNLLYTEDEYNVFALTLPIHQEIEFNPVMSM